MKPVGARKNKNIELSPRSTSTESDFLQERTSQYRCCCANILYLLVVIFIYLTSWIGAYIRQGKNIMKHYSNMTLFKQIATCWKSDSGVNVCLKR